MISISSLRMKLLRVSFSRFHCCKKETKKDITINTKTYLNVRYGSILVHYHEVWPPRRMGQIFKHISIIKFTCSYPAHQCHPKETQHMCPDEDENEARLLYHQISTSSPITPINFPLAELRAILPFQDLKWELVDHCLCKAETLLWTNKRAHRASSGV